VSSTKGGYYFTGFDLKLYCPIDAKKPIKHAFIFGRLNDQGNNSLILFRITGRYRAFERLRIIRSILVDLTFESN
jgi:hypothetical protein